MESQLTSAEHLRMSAQNAKSYTDNLAAEVAQTVADALVEMDVNKADKPSTRKVIIEACGWGSDGDHIPIMEGEIFEVVGEAEVDNHASEIISDAEPSQENDASEMMGDETEENSSTSMTNEDENYAEDDVTDEEVAEAISAVLIPADIFVPECHYYYCLAVDGLTAHDRVNVTISPNSADAAHSCGLISACVSEDGYVVFGAERKPASDMEAEIWVEKG